MKIPIFPGKYHQNGGFSMAMLVYRKVTKLRHVWLNASLGVGWTMPVFTTMTSSLQVEHPKFLYKVDPYDRSKWSYI